MAKSKKKQAPKKASPKKKSNANMVTRKYALDRAIMTPSGGINPRLKVSFKYHDYQNLTSGALSHHENTYVLNGLYDIDNTGSGYQPVMFDDLKLLYDLARVDSVNVSVRFTNGTAVPVKVGLLWHENLAGLAVISTYASQVINNDSTFSAVAELAPAGSTGDTKVVSRHLSNWKLVGSRFNDDDYTGSFVGNPSSTTGLRVFAQTINGGLLTGVHATVSMRLNCTLSRSDQDDGVTID